MRLNKIGEKETCFVGFSGFFGSFEVETDTGGLSGWVKPPVELFGQGRGQCFSMIPTVQSR